MDNLLNILIRTNDRPNYFNRLLKTIHGQTYKNYRLIISADSSSTESYVKASGYNPVPVKKLYRSKQFTFPWNLYLNTLISKVKAGWIMFIDDDDMFAHMYVLEMISKSLPDENNMLIWKMCFPDGRTVPGSDFWRKTPFTRTQISMQCFAFHSRWKDKLQFDGQRAGDYRFTNRLLEYVNPEWLDIVAVQLSNFGNAGKTVDLEHE
jgi:glycosyltransferase involved in cell wall biosynthesis